VPFRSTAAAPRRTGRTALLKRAAAHMLPPAMIRRVTTGHRWPPPGISGAAVARCSLLASTGILKTDRRDL